MLDEHFYVGDNAKAEETTVKEVVNQPVITNTAPPVQEEKKSESEDEVLKELLDGLDV